MNQKATWTFGRCLCTRQYSLAPLECALGLQQTHQHSAAGAWSHSSPWDSPGQELNQLNQLLAEPATGNKKASVLMLTSQESEIVNNSRRGLQRMRMGL